MNQYTIYNSLTGEITGHLSVSSDQVPDRSDVIPGRWDATLYHVQHGQAVEHSAAPVSDLPYRYDVELQCWIVDHDAAAIVVRQQRNTLLTAVDRINPVWYNSLTSEQQSELIAYRQSLLSVPQQSGFPEQVDWPAKPAWL